MCTTIAATDDTTVSGQVHATLKTVYSMLCTSTAVALTTPAMLMFCWMNHRSAIGIGVVRQLVKVSAGNSGFIGSSSCAAHGASTMQSDDGELPRLVLGEPPLALPGRSAASPLALLSSPPPACPLLLLPASCRRSGCTVRVATEVAKFTKRVSSFLSSYTSQAASTVALLCVSSSIATIDTVRQCSGTLQRTV
jgi:hypothetical protein